MLVADQAVFVVLVTTANICAPSAVRTREPTGISAAELDVKRENVTTPVAATAGRRINVMSAIQLSRSAPLLVAARVVRSTSSISHCIQSPSEALASKTARKVDPTVRSSSWEAEACTAAAMFWTNVENVCRDNCIYDGTENESTWVSPDSASTYWIDR